MGWRRWLGRVDSEPRRDQGAPPSGNGASSFHLFWQLPVVSDPVLECSVMFELLDEPQNDRLIFWALQANFNDGSRPRGGAHFGFQWHPHHATRRVVCWGGYAEAGGELTGDEPFPGALDGNANICHYPWTSFTPWHWRIRPTPARPGWWRAEVTAPGQNTPVAIRDLYSGGSELRDLMVWSEVFAHCDDPPVRVRWSDMAATTARGETIRAVAVSVNYQSYPDGGCSNTNSYSDASGVIQHTNTERTTPQGAVLDLA